MIQDTPKNYGYKVPEVKPTDYIFGSGQVSIEAPLRPDGNWSDAIPQGEQQIGRFFDTDNCTAFGSTGQIETLAQAKFQDGTEYSERALGIAAGTDPSNGGNDPNKVYETIRTQGLCLNALLPFDPSINSVSEYYQPKPLPQNIIDAMAQFPKKYSFKHDWVGTPGQPVSQDQMKQALQFSPIAVSVYAWAFDTEKQLYVRNGADCHWVFIYGYEDGKYWKVWDSYDVAGNYEKDLEWDFGFTYVKRIHLEAVPLDPAQISLYQELLGLMAQVLQLLSQLAQKVGNKLGFNVS